MDPIDEMPRFLVGFAFAALAATCIGTPCSATASEYEAPTRPFYDFHLPLPESFDGRVLRARAVASNDGGLDTQKFELRNGRIASIRGEAASTGGVVATAH